MRWHAREARWHVSTSQGTFTSNFVVSAVGPLTEPALPDIDGLDEFEGEVFHSACWNHDFDLTGKRVAVIGTGASAIQIIPELAKMVRQLDVYRRPPRGSSPVSTATTRPQNASPSRTFPATSE